MCDTNGAGSQVQPDPQMLMPSPVPDSLFRILESLAYMCINATEASGPDFRACCQNGTPPRRPVVKRVP